MRKIPLGDPLRSLDETENRPRQHLRREIRERDRDGEREERDEDVREPHRARRRLRLTLVHEQSEVALRFRLRFVRLEERNDEEMQRLAIRAAKVGRRARCTEGL